MEQAIKSGRNTSPGFDNINYSTIKILPSIAKGKLLNIFNYTWKSNCLNKTWKTRIEIPILNQNKNSNENSSFKPISLNSRLTKILGRILKTRLE